MPVRAENYNNEKHDERTVARLVFESDPVFNTLAYGRDAIGVIEEMLRLGDNYAQTISVNRDKEGTIRFYEPNGFRRLTEGSTMHKGHELSQVLMGRG